jgi:hypothetical protein
MHVLYIDHRAMSQASRHDIILGRMAQCTSSGHADLFEADGLHRHPASLRTRQMQCRRAARLQYLHHHRKSPLRLAVALEL